MTSCSNSTIVRIDPALLNDCDKPQLKGKTWRDVAELAAERGLSIDKCNIRLEAARESIKNE